MNKKLLSFCILLSMATFCLADDKVSFEADADAASSELFSDISSGATLVVGTSKACDHLKSAHSRAKENKITILFSDDQFSHFFDGQCDGKCDLLQLNNLSVYCKKQSGGKACMPYAGILNSKIYTLSYDPTIKSIQEACFKR